MSYKEELQRLDETLFSEMRICSFDLVCQGYKIDFVAKDKYELYRLYKEKESVSSYFSIPGSQENTLKIYLSSTEYKLQIERIKNINIVNFLIVSLMVAFLSILFSFYTLLPLRNALRLTEEFIKDILHDFNTPLSTLRLNSSMLKKELGENSKISRIEKSVQTILNLQSNLKAYLSNHESQKTVFSLKEIIDERGQLLTSSYKQINFRIVLD